MSRVLVLRVLVSRILVPGEFVSGVLVLEVFVPGMLVALVLPGALECTCNPFETWKWEALDRKSE